MGHLEIYDSLKKVPTSARKQIEGGRLRGMTNINPMWRIKAMTKQFGPCGVGWKYEIADKHLERGANDEISAFVDVNLYIKADGSWSDPIPGTGGAAFVANEKGGLHTSDECFKMALTDALSVACKALGLAADVYWDKDITKYDQPDDEKPGNRTPPDEDAPFFCEVCGIRFADYWDGERLIKAEAVAGRQRQRFEGRALCVKCGKRAMRGGEAT